MFSKLLKKIEQMPFRTLFGVAAGLVFLCQLVAMVLVVKGQVEKAHFREVQYQSARSALAQCHERYDGEARSLCIGQANAVLNPYSALTHEPETRVVLQVADQGSTGAATGNQQGYKPAVFVNRQ